MNILLRNKIILIKQTKSENRYLRYINIIPLFGLMGLGMYSFRKRKKYIILKNKPTLHISKKLSSYFYNSLLSDELRKNSMNLANNIFTHTTTKKCLCELIKGALDDKEVLLKLKTYASSLFIYLIKDKRIKDQLICNVILLMQNKEIKKESTELLKSFLDFPKTKEVLISFCREVSMKEDIKQMFTNLVMDSAINTMRMAETKKKGAEFISDIWSDPIVRWNMFKKSVMFWQSSSQGPLNNNNNNIKH